MLLLEASEDLIPPSEFGYILRSLGERGIPSAVDAVVSPDRRPRATSCSRAPWIVQPAGANYD